MIIRKNKFHCTELKSVEVHCGTRFGCNEDDDRGKWDVCQPMTWMEWSPKFCRVGGTDRAEYPKNFFSGSVTLTGMKNETACIYSTDFLLSKIVFILIGRFLSLLFCVVWICIEFSDANPITMLEGSIYCKRRISTEAKAKHGRTSHALNACMHASCRYAFHTLAFSSSTMSKQNWNLHLVRGSRIKCKTRKKIDQFESIVCKQK